MTNESQSKNVPHPIDLELTDRDTLRIRWSDDQQREYGFGELRDSCPCATCRDKRNQPIQNEASLLPVLTPEEAQPLRVTGMKPVGNYAYAIAFTDGHDTGIYTLQSLRTMGREV